MMAKLTIYTTSIILLASFVTFVHCGANYAVLAPKIIRPRADYNVIVSLHDIQDRTQIKCELKKSNALNTDFAIKELAFDNQNTFQVFKMAIGLDWSEGQYNLTVTGSGGLTFKEIIQVEYVYKRFVIMIQSDKAIYKPGQNVLFRVVILDDVLRPVDIKDIQDMKIFIIDPLDNKLRVFLLNSGEISTTQSIYGTNKFNYSRGISNDLSFELHQNVQPGQWKIQAITRGQVQNYTFYVDYYTLPLANVTITLPDFVTFKSPIIEYQIDCFYTFGKPVNGTINISLTKIKDCNGISQQSNVYKLNPMVINGQIRGKLDLGDTRLLNHSCNEMRFNMTAVIIDKTTDSVYTNFEAFDVLQHDLKAEPMNQIKKFKPGKEIRQQVQISSHSGKLIGLTTIDNLECRATFKKVKTTNFSKAIPLRVERSQSEIVCDFKTESTFDYFESTIYDKVTDSVLWTSDYGSLQGCTPTYIQSRIQEPTKPLNVGQVTNLVVESNEPIHELIYYIVIRGSIVNASKVLYKESNQVVELPILLIREMVPEALVAIFMSSAEGVIVSDSLILSVTGLFHNKVNISVATPLVDAGQKANMIISAESDSQLFLLGVDEAVLALKQGNDLTEKRILRDLTFNYANRNNPIGFMQSGMEFRTQGQKECPGNYYDLDTFDPDDEGVTNKNTGQDSIRKDFRETWIWDKVQIPHEKTRIGISKKVPDSITSWRVTAFALHDEKGLGLTTLPGHVTVFRPFFIKLNLPYSIRREEESNIHIMVFNYLNQTAQVELKVYLKDTTQTKDLTINNCTQKLRLLTNNIKTITCTVKAHHVGKFDLVAEATAISDSSDKTKFTDGELRPLLVVYEGVSQSESKSVYFDLTEDENAQLKDVVNIQYPEGKIDGSESVFVSATAELITTTWRDKLQDIIKSKNPTFDFSIPTACCQQRVVGYFPKVYWLDFLESSKKGTQSDKDKAVQVIQRTVDLLCFQNPNDGSFVYFESAEFGWMNNIIASGKVKSSVWQTAYTVKLLNHAKKYILVDKNIITRAVNWLKRKQVPSGEFIETDPEHSLFQTTNFNAYLTSYVYISMNTDGEKNVNSAAETYLARTFPTLTHPLDIVISCYALNIAEHKDRDVCYSKVLNISKDENGMKFWNGINGKPDLQVSAYGLMLLNLRKSYTISLKVFKFIASHQSPEGKFTYGGWETDSLLTVICTEAMAQYVNSLKAYDAKTENMFVEFVANGTKKDLHIKPENEIIQTEELNSGTKQISIIASGYGRALARVYWQWNTKETKTNAFNLTTKKIQKNGDTYINFDFCTSYNLDKIAKNAVMEIDLPSGYQYHSSKQLTKSDLIDRIESTNADTHLNIYLQKITKAEFCVTIPCVQSFKVSNSKPVPIKIYPSYDRSLITVQSYNV